MTSEEKKEVTRDETAAVFLHLLKTKAYDGSVLHRSEWGPEAAALAKGTGVRDVVEEAIGTAQIRPGAVTMENLNVLAKNVVNPFTDGTKEGWAGGGAVVNIDGPGNVLRLPYPNHSFASSPFTVLPDDLYVFKFGLESLTGLTGYLGLYIGLTRNRAFAVYQYNFSQKKWGLISSANTNVYFLHTYITAARKYYTTYILGSRAAIAQVPAPLIPTKPIQYTAYSLPGPILRAG
jgi:hypothetical protein